jgi:hypothetical protein
MRRAWERRGETAYTLAGKPQERDQFENLSVGGRTLLKSILKLYRRVVTGFMFLRIGIVRDFYEQGSKPSS